jgi:NADPH:quinone reductase-like Zn-dependent oxidoreductase
MALTLARAAGCKVILTSSSDSAPAQVKAMAGIGHIETINYAKTPDWDVKAVELNGGTGVDIVLENEGTCSSLKSLNATAKR